MKFLTLLDLSETPISTCSVKFLSQSSNLSALSTLRLRACPYLDNKVVRYLYKYNKLSSLELVDLSHNNLSVRMFVD